MIERFVLQKRAVRRCALEHRELHDLANSEWDLLEKLIELLEPIEKLSKIVIICVAESCSYFFSVLPRVVSDLGADPVGEKAPSRYCSSFRPWTWHDSRRAAVEYRSQISGIDRTRKVYIFCLIPTR
jgi:hypothetical protein